MSLRNLLVASVVLLGVQGRPPDLPFRIHPIDPGASETAAVADINRDGRLDIVSGEYWYQAPAWTKHKFREVGFSSNYIDSFSLMPVDVNADGYPDLVDVSWFARKIAWWKNPGRSAGAGLWQETEISGGGNVEFAVQADMDNDGRALEIGFMAHNGSDPGEKEPLGVYWYEFRPLAAQGRGRGGAANQVEWIRHLIDYGGRVGGGMQIPVPDIDGDGDRDLVCAGKSGLFFVENLTKTGAKTPGQ